jgi:hypothetical protein
MDIFILEKLMKHSKIMLAVAALSLGATAFAAPNVGRIAISSGASAAKGNFALALANRCTAASGVFTEFANGNNTSTYVCANNTKTNGPSGTYLSSPNSQFINFAGSSYAEVRLNVGIGSFSAVCVVQPGATSTTWTGGSCGTTADTYVNPALASNALAAYPAGAQVVGGLMDVESEAWPATVTSGLTLPTLDNAGVAQTFGVAVSNDLYTAMFNDQKTAGLLPSSCVVTDYRQPGCVPIIGKAQMASIMYDNEFNLAYSLGAQFLAPSLPANTVLTYARRADTSGTQAAAQLYFMGTKCSLNPLPVVPQSAGLLGNINVQGQGSTGGVRTQLNLAGQYSIGVMSGENNQTGQSWKWVRVNGGNMSESALPADALAIAPAAITNTKSAIAGGTDFWFETKIAVGPAAGATTFWTAVKAGLATVAPGTTKGLFNAAESAFSKNGIACQTPSTLN